MTTLDLGPWDCAGQAAIPASTAPHAAVVGRCGHLLSDAESISRGYGPVCWAKEHGASDAPAARAHDVSPAQLALLPAPEPGPVPGDDYTI